MKRRISCLPRRVPAARRPGAALMGAASLARVVQRRDHRCDRGCTSGIERASHLRVLAPVAHGAELALGDAIQQEAVMQRFGHYALIAGLVAACATSPGGTKGTNTGSGS